MSGNENRRRAWEDLERLTDCIEETFEERTDTEIAEDARVEGVDLRSEAERVRAVIARARQTVATLRRNEARAAYERDARDLDSSHDEDRPEEFEAQLALLSQIKAARPDLLFAYRDFESINPDDAKSLLRQLQQLGVPEALGSGEESGE